MPAQAQQAQAQQAQAQQAQTQAEQAQTQAQQAQAEQAQAQQAQAQAQIDAYIKQLTPMEKKVLQIAREHLETSFSLENSIGFIKWQAGQTIK